MNQVATVKAIKKVKNSPNKKVKKVQIKRINKIKPPKMTAHQAILSHLQNSEIKKEKNKRKIAVDRGPTTNNLNNMIGINRPIINKSIIIQEVLVKKEKQIKNKKRISKKNPNQNPLNKLLIFLMLHPHLV